MKNKRLQKFLLLLVVAIWGMVALRVYGTVSEGTDDQAKSASPEAGTGSRQPAFVYTADVRDPFHFAPSVHARDSTRKNTTLIPKPVWTAPALKLTGILQNRARKKTAIVENSTGGVYFLSEGDTVSGAKILKIGTNEVSYLFQKQKSQWILEAQ